MASRIPQILAELVAYLSATKEYMSAATFGPVSVTVAASTSQNLLSAENLPEYLSITLANTGAVGVAPDLHFCMANDEEDSCDPLTAVTVAAGSSTTVTVGQLGGPGKHHLNVTNVHATNSTTCVVTFQPNWQRLGLLETVKQKWENDAGLIVSKYVLSQNPLTHTANLKEQLKTLPAAFRAFAQPVLKTIEGSVNIMDADYGIFNIAKRDTTPTAREPIADSPATTVKAAAGCSVVVSHKTFTDASRPSRHPDSDAVEIRWVALDLSSPPPATQADCPNVEIVTKAKHTMTFDTALAGKRLYMFSRWRNNSEPHKSSPWSGMVSVVLSF